MNAVISAKIADTQKPNVIPFREKPDQVLQEVQVVAVAIQAAIAVVVHLTAEVVHVEVVQEADGNL